MVTLEASKLFDQLNPAELKALRQIALEPEATAFGFRISSP